ncbi:AHH domain-containing protein [[Empedobacter] haloabium]|uniref:AHH domain-containing protein n=1 Tax=[Empedobacter] haloabium TaxID=592317 RepID=A0ABZ1UI57_9BURK
MWLLFWRPGIPLAAQVATDAFGNALGSSIAKKLNERSTETSSQQAPSQSIFDSADEQLRRTYYPAASLTEDAYAQREQLARWGVIPKNAGPEMSIAASTSAVPSGDYITLRSFDAGVSGQNDAMLGIEATYHRFVEGNTNAAALGITDAQVDADIANGARGPLDAASYAARKTAYLAWNFVTAGFVERHDDRIRAEANGRLTNGNFLKATAVDVTTTLASMAVAGRVGGYVAGRAGSGYLGYGLAGAAAGGSFDLSYQAGRNLTHLVTDGQSGQFGFSGKEFGDAIVYGAGFGVAGKYLSEYGQYKIQLNSEVTNDLYSGFPLPFRLVAPDKFNYGAYLRNAIGGPPEGMPDPHAHHILFKEGNGPAQKALVREGQELLRRYDIDPIYGVENLAWAPNRVAGQHGINALRNVVNELKSVEQFGGNRADIVKALDELGQAAARRR